MEENRIWSGETCFCIDIENKTYGCWINENERFKAKEIIKYFRNNRKKQIEA